jgi:hypothetical protein
MTDGSTSTWRLPQSKCRSCGARIQWVEMESGSRMPLDVNSQRMVVVGDDGKGHVLAAFTSHFATCPNASEHRKGGK